MSTNSKSPNYSRARSYAARGLEFDSFTTLRYRALPVSCIPDAWIFFVTAFAFHMVFESFWEWITGMWPQAQVSSKLSRKWCIHFWWTYFCLFIHMASTNSTKDSQNLLDDLPPASTRWKLPFSLKLCDDFGYALRRLLSMLSIPNWYSENQIEW